MKILHLLASDTSSFAREMISTLQNREIEQLSFTAIDAPSLWRNWHQKVKLRRLIAREKPDIVQCWSPRAAALGGVKKSMRPVWLGWFGGYYDPDKFRNCEHLVGCTRDIAAHMVKNGVPADRAHYIPTFPDITTQPPLDRALFSTPRDAKVLLALSRLHPKKGLDTLLQSLQSLPDCVAWLAGEGPIKRELETLAKKLGVMDRVRFLGWRTDRSALLRSADICVLPSRYEPFGTVILEAWAAGTPLVAARSAGPAAHVEDGVTGMLVPIDDANALTGAIRKTLDDGNLRRALVAQGYAAYVKDYTRESVTRQWQTLYASLLK